MQKRIKIKCGPKDHHKITEGSPKDETLKNENNALLLYIYLVYIYILIKLWQK